MSLTLDNTNWECFFQAQNSYIYGRTHELSWTNEIETRKEASIRSLHKVSRPERIYFE